MGPDGPTSMDTERPRSFSRAKTSGMEPKAASSCQKFLLGKAKLREEQRNSSELEMISAASEPCSGEAQVDTDMPASENETEFELDFPGYESAHSEGDGYGDADAIPAAPKDTIRRASFSLSRLSPEEPLFVGKTECEEQQQPIEGIVELTEEGPGHEQQQPIEGTMEPAEDADEFQYAFEGKSREGKFHVLQFKSCSPPQDLLTDVRNNPLEAVVEEEEHDIHIPVPRIQGGELSELGEGTTLADEAQSLCADSLEVRDPNWVSSSIAPHEENSYGQSAPTSSSGNLCHTTDTPDTAGAFNTTARGGHRVEGEDEPAVGSQKIDSLEARPLIGKPPSQAWN
eukprot:evm.model.scf_707.6 EVM.evm.TU.scf_707.6   scf_707:34462-36583(+)